jgi:hypothetical protein
VLRGIRRQPHTVKTCGDLVYRWANVGFPGDG